LDEVNEANIYLDMCQGDNCEETYQQSIISNFNISYFKSTTNISTVLPPLTVFVWGDVDVTFAVKVLCSVVGVATKDLPICLLTFFHSFFFFKGMVFCCRR
jgi:hypothetical protein